MLTKDNDVQSKKAAEAEGKVKGLETEKDSVQKLLDKEKVTNTTTQVGESFSSLGPCVHNYDPNSHMVFYSCHRSIEMIPMMIYVKFNTEVYFF